MSNVKTEVKTASAVTAPAPAGPVKIKWIQIVKDASEPKRVFYQADTGTNILYHYFDLNAMNTGQVKLLADAMADDSDIYYTGSSGNSINYIQATKSAPAGQPAPRLPAGATHNTHDPVENIRTTQ
ncbi:MAG TPA: hypothetical protein PKA06_02330 [Gemmatales bacterium]|nr:hypothetical protein [Gemmatales bacterium]HMP17586.1 hypothetical protein [Gemmatales bacterium]